MKGDSMLILLLLLVSVAPAVACEVGCTPFAGVCACEPTTYTAPLIIPSPDKPPKDKMPSYQREGIIPDMPESLRAQDEKMDAEIREAELVGKRAAGLVR